MTTITVTNSAELWSALNQLSATGGTIKVVNSGSDYKLTASNIGNTSNGIAIVADDESNPPVFSYLTISNSKNITFDGISFDNTNTSTYVDKTVQVNGSDNITLTNITMVGASDGYYAGQGTSVVGGTAISIRESSNTNVINSSISNYGNAISVINSDDTKIYNNDISKISFDGIKLTGVQDTLIAGNYLHDFYGSDQNYNHSDMIQVFSHSITNQNTENLTIRDNIITASSAASQTIFVGNELATVGGEQYKNITVENNTIYNGHSNGIMISGTDGVIISDNTLLWNSSATMKSTNGNSSTSMPAIKISNVSDAVVSNNIAGNYSIPGAEASDNITISQNSLSENYVGNHFINVVKAGNIDIRDLTLLSDSDLNGHGSSATQSSSTVSGADGVTAVVQQGQSIYTPGTVIYDASLSYDGRGVLNPETTRYIWTFDDGKTAEGVSVSYTWSTSGTHTVTLTVITENGSDTIARQSVLVPDVVISLSFDDVAASTDAAGSSALEAGKTDASGESFHLDGASKYKITGTQLSSRQNFTLALSAKLDEADDSGILVNYHNSLWVASTSTGAVKVTVKLKDGTLSSVISADGVMSDGSWHRIAFAVEGGDNGALVLYVDGVAVAEAAISSDLAFSSTYNLIIGNTFGSSAQASIDDFLLLASVRNETWANSDYENAILGVSKNPDQGGGTGVPETKPSGSDSVEVEPNDANDGDDEVPVSLPDKLGQGLAAASGPLPKVSPLADADLLSIDFDGGIADGSAHQAKIWTNVAGNSNLVSGVEGNAFHLDGKSKIYVDRSNAYLSRPDSFTIAASIKLDEVGDKGVFLNVHHGLTAVVLANGAVQLSLQTENGWKSAVTEAGLLSDTDWHRVTFTFDGSAGGAGIQIYVDGVLSGSASLEGTVNWGWPYHLVVGNTFGDSITATVDDIALDSSAISAADVAEDYAATLSKLTDAPDDDASGVYTKDGMIIGTENGDLITGTDGDDLIFSRGGADTIDGGAGADGIVWDRTPVAGEADRIVGFDMGEGDRLLFSADLFDLDTGSTVLDAGQLALSSDAVTAETRFIYDAKSGALYWDEDGSGSAEAIKIAEFDRDTELSHQAFLVF